MHIFENEPLADSMLFDFNRICKSLGLYWWVTAGTALGIYRNGQLIPWDEDMDVAIFCTDVQYTEIFTRLFNEFGFLQFSDLSEIEGVHFRCGIGHAYKGGKTNQDSILLDIWRIGVERVRSIAPRFFKVTALFKYKGMHVGLPHPIERYLHFLYGDTWRTPQCSQKQMRNILTRADPVAQAKLLEMLK